MAEDLAAEQDNRIEITYGFNFKILLLKLAILPLECLSLNHKEWIIALYCCKQLQRACSPILRAGSFWL